MTEKELKEQYSKFCREMLVQVELSNSGKDTAEWFRSDLGLCPNLEQFLEIKHLPLDCWDELSDYQSSQFQWSDLHHTYPFNNGDRIDYLTEPHRYKNAARLQWLRDHS